jgi:hypothetical protein
VIAENPTVGFCGDIEFYRSFFKSERLNGKCIRVQSGIKKLGMTRGWKSVSCDFVHVFDFIASV